MQSKCSNKVGRVYAHTLTGERTSRPTDTSSSCTCYRARSLYASTQGPDRIVRAPRPLALAATRDDEIEPLGVDPLDREPVLVEAGAKSGTAQNPHAPMSKRR